MSVNINVNGKLSSHWFAHNLLDDPEKVQKAEETKRRKLRLLQVREESKKLAKKIRDAVSEEKKRELQKLQDIKQREMELWRQNALKQNNQEHCNAVFHIGSAHRAAREENEAVNAKKAQQQSYKHFRKQIAAKKCQQTKVEIIRHPSCQCELTSPDVHSQFKHACTQTDTKTKCDINKRKRNVCSSSSESECDGESLKDKTKLPQSPFSLSSSYDSTTSMNNDQVTQSSTSVPNKKKSLVKTPAVVLDVEVGTDDSVTINAPIEVNDKYAEYNRKFDRIVCVSPRKGQKRKENSCDTSSMQQSLKTNTLSSDATSKEPVANKSCFVRSENNQTNNELACKEKRFTIISDLVKKQQKSEPRSVESGFVATLPSNSREIAATISTPMPANIQTQVDRVYPSVPLAQTRHKSSAATLRSTGTVSTQPTPQYAATTKSNTVGVSGSISSGRVQFYDYNSKLTKQHNQDPGKVNVQRQRDQKQPSAMEQAELENQRERERQLEVLKKCQIMEERGQKALEREQIRRDCNELTEKLDMLCREYPNQFPANDNQLHIFADKQLRKEGKMNSAIEKLLQAPSIITCSEQSKYIKYGDNQPPTAVFNRLNLASVNSKSPILDDVSSESCCSILLGYVDDQSRLVRRDLDKNDSTHNVSKQKRLKNLLERLEQLRSSLVEELRNDMKPQNVKGESRKQDFSSKIENHKHIVANISEMCKERVDILFNETIQDQNMLNEKEKATHSKENLLQQNDPQKASIKNKDDVKQEKYCTSSDKKNSQTCPNDGKTVNCPSNVNPLEIIITVRGEKPGDRNSNKSKRKKILRRSPSKLSTLIKSPQPSISKAKKHSPYKKSQAKKLLQNQNSYDSNSTSYMSLPTEITTKIDHLTQQIAYHKQADLRKAFKESEAIQKLTLAQDQKKESEISHEPVNNESRLIPPPRVNPLIAQYVHRLLGMSRDAIQNLGVSSSDIETPGSSILNTTDNLTNIDNIVSDDHLRTLHKFIEENKSFIRDFERSIHLQKNVPLEKHMYAFDDIWCKRLKREKNPVKVKKSQETKEKLPTDKPKDNEVQQKSTTKTKERKCLQNDVRQKPKTVPSCEEKGRKTIPSEKLLKDLSRSLSSQCSIDDKESITSSTICNRPAKSFDRAMDAKKSIDSSKSEPDSQLARYAKLTQNCTHRIAELTELINRVREEKQRLLEVTLSSVSDNGRHSTEYLELPESQSNSRTEHCEVTRVSSSSEESTHNKHSLSSTTLHGMHTLSSADKNKHIANSRDSGIAESRPITSLENRTDQEPVSQTSSESFLTQAVRKLKPPPTLKRFSPQLPEEEVAHELSTIFEVDTPATSRINTAAGQPTEERETTFNGGFQEPTTFPTFEQYTQQKDLNQMQQELTTLLECMEQTRSLEGDLICDLNHNETVEECLAKLHISGIYPRDFPALRDYIKRNTSMSLPSDEQQLLDTESLENITDGQLTSNTDYDTASLDIEAELQKRKIIKNPFRIKKQPPTVHKDTVFYIELLAAESGVDKLSTSDNTSDLLDSDLKRKISTSSEDLVKSIKAANVVSSTSTSKDTSAIAESALRAASLDKSSKGSGHVFKLRDFLTRELEKLTNSSGSMTNSSCDESLRSHFLHSLIGSLTPGTAIATSKSIAQTLDRQKTSTPVPMPTSQTHSTASNHSNCNSSNPLFSGESNISSVYYQDRSVRIIAKKGGNADQISE